jgi:hypothetical protein
MEDLADDAQNGISLQGDAHKAFDRFKWTLLAQVRFCLCILECGK